jgi:hypothetical protein
MNRSPMGFSARILKLSRFVRSRLAFEQIAPADHLDPGVLAAFAEQHLPASERTKAFVHLGQCSQCREVLALISAMDPEEIVADSRPTRHYLASWASRSAATAVLTCLIAAVVWLTSVIQRAPVPPKTATRLTVPPPEITSGANVLKRTEPTKAKKRALAEKPVTPENSIALKNRTLSQSPSALVAPNDTGFAPGGNSMFQAESPIAQERTGIAMAGTQQRGTLWRLSNDPGTLEKSDDGGVTWQPIRLDEGASFYALSSMGREIWVGGSNGMLYHSLDEGLHWKKVQVGDEDSQLSGPIIQIESLDRHVLRVATRSSDRWITRDGGSHWRRE